jgi:hypothetical protein
MLRPEKDSDDDYASILQATLELTTLLGNIHDILYPSKTRTVGLMLRGDYTKYLDDFLKALMAWNEQWSGLEISSHLKCGLHLMYEYLCLYVNAFAFQAVISRAPIRHRTSADPRKMSYFPHTIMATADGRFIYEAIRAAKSLLKSIVEDIDPVSHLRYIPSRFYLYGIYSAVFLYKASLFGATIGDEHDEVVGLVSDFISALEKAATGDEHIGARYGKLLRNLWFRTAGGRPPRNRKNGRSLSRVGVGAAGHGYGNEELGHDMNQQMLLDGASEQQAPPHPMPSNLDVLDAGFGLRNELFEDSGPYSMVSSFVTQDLPFFSVNLPGLNGADLSSSFLLESI